MTKKVQVTAKRTIEVFISLLHIIVQLRKNMFPIKVVSYLSSRKSTGMKVPLNFTRKSMATFMYLVHFEEKKNKRFKLSLVRMPFFHVGLGLTLLVFCSQG